MKKRYNFIFLAIVMMFTMLFGIKIKAANIKLNDTIYFLDTKDWGDIYMYIFNSNTNIGAWNWQDEQGKMTDTGIDINNHDLYAYTLTNSYYQDYHNTIVFSSKSSGKQTKDLAYIKKDILFAPSIQASGSSNFDGEWYIKDKSQLKTLITNADNKIEEQYTATSYQNLQNVLNTKLYSYSSSGYTSDRDYKESFTGVKDIANTDLILVTLDGYSVYDDAVTDLDNAINNLVFKNKIITSSSTGGSITTTSKYFEDNETIKFNVNPLVGYETKEIVITKITGYDSNNNPILSTKDEDITKVNLNDTKVYSYTAKDNDIYISVTFKKKTFTITTTIDNNGTIDPNGPITVEYGEDKEFNITANKGYSIKKVSVNGNDYELSNGVLKLSDITENTEITVSFQINTYTVTIDDNEYKLSYGSKITDLDSYDDIINKTGYTFKGFTKADTDDEFDTNTTIENDIKLDTHFEKIIYTVIIDDIEYKIAYGNKITDLDNYDNIINKDGYVFKGFAIKDTNQDFNPNSEIKNDVNLVTIFEKKSTDNNTQNNSGNKVNNNSNINNVPNTGDKIIFSIVGIVIALIGGIVLILLRKNKNK